MGHYGDLHCNQTDKVRYKTKKLVCADFPQNIRNEA